MSTNTKLQKTIQRTQEKIQAGQFYEAHQATRTIAARYVRQKAYNDAVEVLYATAKLLLEHKEESSGSDLTLYLLQVYNQAGIKVDTDSRAKLTQLLRMFSCTEPTLKKIGHEANQWAMENGEIAHGDPELNHVLGSIFVQADEAYEAEKYLLLGTKSSCSVLTNFLYQWYCENDDVTTAPMYLSRAVLGYLVTQNIRDAKLACVLFLKNLVDDKKLEHSIVDKDDISVHIFDDAPLLDFLQLLIITCQYRNADMYNRLKTRYSSSLSNITALDKALAKIAYVYFNIQPQRQQNMLQDLMGSIFQ